jgi:hypothetical protein
MPINYLSGDVKDPFEAKLEPQGPGWSDGVKAAGGVRAGEVAAVAEGGSEINPEFWDVMPTRETTPS